MNPLRSYITVKHGGLVNLLTNNTKIANKNKVNKLDHTLNTVCVDYK
jgi:hypothetical protein